MRSQAAAAAVAYDEYRAFRYTGRATQLKASYEFPGLLAASTAEARPSAATLRNDDGAAMFCLQVQPSSTANSKRQHMPPAL